MTFRPDDWNNPNEKYKEEDIGICSVQSMEYGAYEAGADAILQVMLDEFTCAECSTPNFIHLVLPKNLFVAEESV